MAAPQRARSHEDKEVRAQAILDAALALCAEASFPSITMAQVAARAGLAKGTLFLYFPTKEALGLALVERLLRQWFAVVDAHLDNVEGVAGPAEVARLITASVMEHRQLVALLTILGTILEHNVDAETATRFKQGLVVQVLETGARLERVLPFLHPGDGGRVVLLVHALVIGLQQMAHPAPIVAQVLAAPELRVLRIDFADELTLAVRVHLEGLQALHSAGSNTPNQL